MSSDMFRFGAFNFILGLGFWTVMNITFIIKVTCMYFNDLTRHMSCFSNPRSRGFDARIRDLTNQILISARRLNETKSSGDNMFLEKVYQQVSGLGRNSQGLNKTGFVDLFSKNIIYVLAMSSQLKNDLKRKEHIEKYTSNIARFSLITCSTDARGFYEILTYQIPRI